MSKMNFKMFKLNCELQKISKQCRKCPKYPGDERKCDGCELLYRAALLLKVVTEEAEKAETKAPADDA